MAGNNMESLLLGGDDSSSGESDSETVPAPAAAAATVGGTTQRPPAAAAPAPAPAAATTAPPVPTPGSMSQSEMQKRLKSMYSPATKAGGTAPATGPPTTAAPPPVRPAQPTQPANMQRPTQPVQKPPQQQAMAPAPSSHRAQSGGSMLGMAPPPQHRSGIQHQMPPRASSVPHASDPQRSASGSLPPTQQNPRAMSSSSHSTQPMSSRPAVPHQAQQPRSSGMPPHQPTVRRNSHGQTQQSMPSSSRAPTGMAPPPTQQPSQSRTSSGYAGQPPSQPPAGMPPGGSSSSAHAAMERDRELKKQKEKFLIFTRVLMKYLEQKDPPLHVKVKAIIKDCAERNRKKEPGYESVTASMKIQLKRVVNDSYWKRAEAYLDHFLKEKANSGSQSAMSMSSSSTNQGAIPSSAPSSNAASAEAAKRRAMEMQRQQQAAVSRPPTQEPVQASIASLRDDMAKKRQAVAGAASSVPRPGGPPKIVPAATAAAKGKAAAAKSRPKGASTPTGQQPRKTSLSSIGGSDGMTLPNASAMNITLYPSREYNDLMEQIDHASNFDWTTAGSIMGDETRWTITEEQRRLIYDSKTTVNAGTVPEDDFDPPTFPIAGWSQRNVISSRVAWSRLRRGRKQLEPTANPVVAGGLLSLSAIPGQSAISMEGKEGATAQKEIDSVWFNEEKAEEDEALAVLSEGAEIYIRSVLEKALHCARQRQNLDGIRLWHQQRASGESEKPHLSLRLGCDVSRQVAQAIGNATMTCKRMEEALERQPDVPDRLRVIHDDTLKTASSMSELALLPKLGKATAEAVAEGKRNFDVYNGKNATEPPFGRVPKMAKLEVVDFQTGMNFVQPGRRHRASTLSSSFFY